MTIKGIDCATRITTDKANALYGLGYRFACRYLVPDKYSKHLSREEAQILTDEGFKILSIFETTADRAKGGASNGTADGAMALECARNIGMPTSGYIYFAVDFNAAPSDMGTIEAYLKAASAQTGEYKIGVYGSYDVVETIAARDACDGFWQTYAWSNKKRSEHAVVYQYLNDQFVADINVDLNEAVSFEGFWDYNNTESDLNMTIDEAKTELTELAGTGGTHSDWASEAVTKLTAAGIFTGDGKGNYGWEQCITREAVAEVLYTAFQKLGLLNKF